jgi:hypothetical protein
MVMLKCNQDIYGKLKSFFFRANYCSVRDKIWVEDFVIAINEVP